MDYLRRVRERQKFPSSPLSVRYSDLSSPSFTASDSDDDGQKPIPQIREDLLPQQSSVPLGLICSTTSLSPCIKTPQKALTPVITDLINSYPDSPEMVSRGPIMKRIDSCTPLTEGYPYNSLPDADAAFLRAAHLSIWGER